MLNGSRSDELSLSIDPYRSPWAVIVSLRSSDDVNDNNFLRETRIVCFFRHEIKSEMGALVRAAISINYHSFLSEKNKITR